VHLADVVTVRDLRHHDVTGCRRPGGRWSSPPHDREGCTTRAPRGQPSAEKLCRQSPPFRT
jgi:hypothetical protein